MKIFILALSLMVSLPSWSKGKMLLIGGGSRPDVIIDKMIELSQGAILVIPLASEIPQEVAESIKLQLESRGASSVKVFSCDHTQRDLPECLQEIREAGLIFFTGGSQARLLDGLSKTSSLALIRERFEKENLSISGTSAGTAIMSEVMLTGNTISPYTSFDGIRPNMVETTQGFGFLKNVILDQHFLKRARQNRLISTVLDHPHLVGVGVDEATAILVHEDESFTVLGESSVMIIDARKARIGVRNAVYETSGVEIQLLSHGQSARF